MATNPFEDDAALYHVLVNVERQHSLWPVFAEIPAGWTAVLSDVSRAAALEYVERHWRDMRPASLADVMDAEQR